jgi:hypothetical protein
MGAFRDDQEALRARIDVLETELRQGRREAALQELAALREDLATATARMHRDELQLSSLAARLETLEGTIQGDPVVPPAALGQRAVVTAMLVGVLVLGLVVGFAVVASGPPEPIVVAPIPPTAPIAPAPVPPPDPEEPPFPLPAEGEGSGDRLVPTRAEIAAALRGAGPDMQACGHTDGWVRATVTFGSDGTAQGTRLDDSAERSTSAECFHRVLRRIRVAPFERPTFSVTYPYRMTSQGTPPE